MRAQLRSRIRSAAKKVLGERSSLTIQEQFPDCEIGRWTYGSPRVRRSTGDDGTLRIGAFCSIANEVQILLEGDHRVDWATTFPFGKFWPEGRGIKGHPVSRGDVHIGNDVWIGASAMVLSGVCIGDGAVVGARAVVAKDVPPYAIVVGNPAQVVRKRFDEETIERLLAVRWWDWPDDVIASHVPLLLNDDVEAFLSAAEALS